MWGGDRPAARSRSTRGRQFRFLPHNVSGDLNVALAHRRAFLVQAFEILRRRILLLATERSTPGSPHEPRLQERNRFAGKPGGLMRSEVSNRGIGLCSWRPFPGRPPEARE
jgi:hypothetical protein